MHSSQNFFTYSRFKNGFVWLKAVNRDFKINLTEAGQDLATSRNRAFFFSLITFSYFGIEKIFPDNYFCICASFPFEQLVIATIKFESYPNSSVPETFVMRFTCTYLRLSVLFSLEIDISRYDGLLWC